MLPPDVHGLSLIYANALWVAAQRIRLLSFNVNGLRALLSQRLKLTMKQFLESLNAGGWSLTCPTGAGETFSFTQLSERHQPHACFIADIVCLQETKLRRSDIDRDVAVVDGW
jgi:exonuclease III